MKLVDRRSPLRPDESLVEVLPDRVNVLGAEHCGDLGGASSNVNLEVLNVKLTVLGGTAILLFTNGDARQNLDFMKTKHLILKHFP